MFNETRVAMIRETRRQFLRDAQAGWNRRGVWRRNRGGWLSGISRRIWNFPVVLDGILEPEAPRQALTRTSRRSLFATLWAETIASQDQVR
jgi:hypothetical protein